MKHLSWVENHFFFPFCPGLRSLISARDHKEVLLLTFVLYLEECQYLLPTLYDSNFLQRTGCLNICIIFQWGIRRQAKAKTAAVYSNESNNIETFTFFFVNMGVFVKDGLPVFAFPRRSEVKLEMILQLNLYIIKKQIPYLYRKIVYHLFYSINLELKLDGLEFNSQNI